MVEEWADVLAFVFVWLVDDGVDAGEEDWDG